MVSVDRWKSFVIADIPGLIEGASDGAGLGIRFLKHLARTRVLLHLVDIAPLDESSPADAAEVIVNELTRFSPSLAERERWLVLNKSDMVMDDERDERVQEVIDRLEWEGPVYVISAISKQGTDKLSHDLMRYLEDRADRLANDPAYAAELADLDQRIEDEARASCRPWTMRVPCAVLASRACTTSVTMTLGMMIRGRRRRSGNHLRARLTGCSTLNAALWSGVFVSTVSTDST